MDDIQNSLLNTINIITDSKIKNIPYNCTLYGEVLEINGSECIVKINEENYTCKILTHALINVGDVVIIQVNNNDTSNKLILGKTGTPTTTTTGTETVITMGTLINNAVDKTTPIDTDLIGLVDSGFSNILKKLSWLNIKTTLKTYFDSLYSLVGHTHINDHSPATVVNTTSITMSINGQEISATAIFGTSSTTIASGDKGVTNGDLHNHSSGDGGQIAYSSLSGLPIIPNKMSELTNDSNFVSDISYIHTDNNYTTIEKNKLANIADGAEVNVNADWNAISGNAQILNKPTTISGYGITDAYTKTEVDNKISAVYKYKGSVTSYTNLPTSGQIIGDVYNVTDSGINYAWDGSGWDDIGGVEALATASNNGLISKEDFSKLAGIAINATQNDTDANLKNRANHTGTQLASTISDFTSTVRSTVLTGLSTATNSVITVSDSILSALGKLQKQISDNLTTLINHTSNTSNPHSVTKTQVGLGSVSNYGLATQAEAEAGTSSAKYMTPLRTKQAIDALQAVKSVAGKTGTVTLTKGDVGLSNVDNTSDANKPISNATQLALNLKANLASPAFTGTPTAPTAIAGINNTQLATTAFVQNTVTALGAGDMNKSIYDTNLNGIVDNAEKVNGIKISVSTSNPVSPSTNDIWIDIN